MLTELEGAILTEIGYRNRYTAFKVRQAFKNSPSTDWQGSAGSVYPAIKRLVKNGLIEATRVDDARRTQRLVLTEHGRDTLLAWARNGPAVGIGIDPFRLRVGLWKTLPLTEQRAVSADLVIEIEQVVRALESYGKNQDPLEKQQVALAIAQQNLRLDWVRKWQRSLTA